MFLEKLVEYQKSSKKNLQRKNIIDSNLITNRKGKQSNTWNSLERDARLFAAWNEYQIIYFYALL